MSFGSHIYGIRRIAEKPSRLFRALSTPVHTALSFRPIAAAALVTSTTSIRRASYIHRHLSSRNKITVVQYLAFITPISTRTRKKETLPQLNINKEGVNATAITDQRGHDGDGGSTEDSMVSGRSRFTATTAARLYGKKVVVFTATHPTPGPAESAWQREDLPATIEQNRLLNNKDGRDDRVADNKRSWNLRTSVASSFFYDRIIRHFLPANYPRSVASGYVRFSLFSLVAATAGSASMVLSTQTLLLAVGVVGSHVTTTSVMAGALNWVLKDGVGQLGGVLFASRMGETRTFDSNPKLWRMVAAMTLDVAALLELLAPVLTTPTTILPLACTANVLKNIGFLTASASRAALHQSLAVSGNLADVTAKTGSQSMAAGMLGTALGVGLSSLVLHHPDPTHYFIPAFAVLAAIHQSCNYMALKAVALRHFNQQRLSIVLQQYIAIVEAKDTATIAGSLVLTPCQVAEREQFLPFVSPKSDDDTRKWLSIGSDLTIVCPEGLAQLERLLASCPYERYILNGINHNDNDDDDGDNEKYHRIHLVFLDTATGQDVIMGILHAHTFYQLYKQQQGQRNSLLTPKAAITQQGLNDEDLLTSSYQCAKGRFPLLLEQLHAAGWNTDTDVTNIEPANAFRLAILYRDHHHQQQ